MKRGQKTSVEQVVLKLRQIEVQRAADENYLLVWEGVKHSLKLPYPTIY